MKPMWCNHPSFRDLLTTLLEATLTCLAPLTALKKRIQWNKYVFGNIFKQLRIIRARLKGIQKSDSYFHSNFLHNLKKELTDKYDSLLKAEKDFWLTKSRINWLTEEDANTSFYHTTSLVRIKRNKILNLEDDSGNMYKSQKDILNHTLAFFKNLYQTDHS